MGNYLIEKVLLFFLKRKVIRNYKKYCKERIGYALLYFKTDAFFLKRLAKKYHHVNFWQSLEIVKILNRMGYCVDIIDRTLNLEKFNIEDKYDLFIGIGGGMSGKNFSKIAHKLNKAKKMVIISSQRIDVFNNAIEARYKYFNERHPNVDLPFLGLKNDINVNDLIKNTDYILCEGEKKTISQYSSYGKKIYQIFCPSSPKVIFNATDLKHRDKNKFLYFGSNRNILKGLDILLDVFLTTPNIELYICTPANESEFNDFYKEKIKNSSNIHWVGFIEIGSKKFEKLTSQCAFVTLLSCTDSSATSVTTCMRKGLIPVITPETDIDVDNFGFLIDNINIDSVKERFIQISNISDEEIYKRSINSYIASQKYTQNSYSEGLENALLEIIYKNNHAK